MAILIVGTLDTKGEEIGFARDRLQAAGLSVDIMDVGILGHPTIESDIPRKTVARAGGESIGALQDAGDRGRAVEVMGEGAAKLAREMNEDGQLDGIMGLGGSGNTSIATTAMRALPYGRPKLMVSTVASGDVRPYVGAHDILMMHSVADIEGLNQLTRRVISNATNAMVGMVEGEQPESSDPTTTIGITMFGVTTPCVKQARSYLEARGYETIVFHATGTGGRAMENLIEQGVIDAVLDVTTTELADELVGGVLSAGPERLTTAGKTGIPQVISVGALDMVNFGPRDTVPDSFEGRHFHVHNPQVTLMRTTPAENEQLGRLLAEKANQATGPVAVAIPTGGVSMLAVEGEEFFNPVADEALFSTLREHLSPSVELIEYDASINDESFAIEIAETLITMLESS